MLQGSNVIERRQEKRYAVREGTYALMHPPANKLGQLLDISMTGLSFCYFSPSGASTEAGELDLLLDEGLSMEAIPCITVRDFVLPCEQPYSQITMRRRGVKFGTLTDRQKNFLRDIITRYGREN